MELFLKNYSIFLSEIFVFRRLFVILTGGVISDDDGVDGG